MSDQAVGGQGNLPPGGSWLPAPECTTVHPYGAEGWRPGADGVHEHYITVSLVVGFPLEDDVERCIVCGKPWPDEYGAARVHVSCALRWYWGHLKMRWRKR